MQEQADRAIILARRVRGSSRCAAIMMKMKTSPSRFLCQEKPSVRGRLKRHMMARLRAERRSVPEQDHRHGVVLRRPAANAVLRRPAAAAEAVRKRPTAAAEAVRKRPTAAAAWLVPRTEYRRRGPCCGFRKDRCICDWSDVEAYLNRDEWDNFVRRVEQAELKYAPGSAACPLKRLSVFFEQKDTGCVFFSLVERWEGGFSLKQY